MFWFSYRHWGLWDGLQSDIYSKQKYDRGQNCWNGPDRSVKVRYFNYFSVLTLV